MKWFPLFVIIVLVGGAGSILTSRHDLKRSNVLRYLDYLASDNKRRHMLYPAMSCERLQKIYLWTYKSEEQNVIVALLWGDKMEKAAAALLRATLIAAGYNAQLVQLYSQKYGNLAAIDSRAIKVEVIVKTHDQTQAGHSTCLRASYDSYQICNYEDKRTETNMTIYVQSDSNHTCETEFLEKLMDMSSKRANFSNVKPYGITDLMYKSNISLFSIVTNDQDSLLPANFVRFSIEPQCNAFPEEIVLLKYSGGFLPNTFVKFSPSLRDLKSIRMFNYNGIGDIKTENIACGWAISKKKQFDKWRSSAVVKQDQKRIIVALCKSEYKDLTEYIYMLNVLGDFKNTSASLIDTSRVLIQLLVVDCPQHNLFNILMHTIQNKIPHNILGFVLADEIKTDLESFIKSSMECPVLSYTRETSFVDALQILLASCGWRRLAILEEFPNSPLFRVLQVNLISTLLVRQMNITHTFTKSDVTRDLKKLLDANVRVIVINARADLAAKFLEAAYELKMTREKGFVWIMSEYNAADEATSMTKPYTVSYSWRGERNDTKFDQDNSNVTNEIELYKKLEERWRDRAWPRYASQILDALLFILDEYKPDARLKKPSLRKVPNSHKKESKVYIQQWDSEPHPRVVATWAQDVAQGPGMLQCLDIELRAALPHDGSKNCLIPYGDPFEPFCGEVLWFPAAVAAVVAVVAVALVTRWARSKFSRHVTDIETKFALRMLARRARVFSMLGEHLVDREALELLQELGTGRFGRVHQGLLRESRRRVVVAAKALREEASSAEESDFLREASTLASLDHENIVRFVGVCVVDGPPLLLMEHAFFGDLLRYLQAHRHLAGCAAGGDSGGRLGSDEKAHISAEALTGLARDAAAALAYLAARGLVHRDVRAANCLVDERRRLKLADFGLARATGTVDGEYATRRGPFPVLWVAPESLATGVSTAAADVWSFGVLVFELVSLGRRPYGALPPAGVVQLVAAGGRPRLPWDAGAEARALARACWRARPDTRPPARRLAAWLARRPRALHPAVAAELRDVNALTEPVESELDAELASPESE